MDIMWRRLSIIVYINIGKIVEALERASIDAGYLQARRS